MVLRQDGRFDGAAALVTGGAHGIGRACAVRLADEGARVAVMDVDEAAAREAVAQLGQIGERPHLALQMDVTDLAQVTSAVASSSGPISVTSRVAASGALPTSWLASTCEYSSMGPPTGTPIDCAPHRPRSWTVVNMPGRTTLRDCITNETVRRSRPIGNARDLPS